MWISWLTSEDELELGKEVEKPHHKYNVIKRTSRLLALGESVRHGTLRTERKHELNSNINGAKGS